MSYILRIRNELLGLVDMTGCQTYVTGLSPLGSKNTFAAWQTTNAEPRVPIFALQCYSLLICYHGNTEL